MDEFFEAITAGDAVKVEALLTALPSLANATRSSKNPTLRALPLAIQSRHVDIVRLLISHGAEIENNTLFQACWGSKVEILELLLNGGANPNLRDQQDRTPLYWPAITGKHAMVELLIRYGSDVNIATEHGPLVCASHVLRNPNIVALMIDAGVNVNVRSPWGTPLHVAARYGSDAVVQMLLAAGADPASTDSEGRTPLNCINPHHFEALEILERHAASPPLPRVDREKISTLKSSYPREEREPQQHRDVGGEIFAAARQGDTARVRELLALDGSLACRMNKHGWTPLMLAAKFGHTAVAKILVDHGAAVTISSGFAELGGQPLHYAARYGHTDVVLLLIEHGADVNPMDVNHETPLFYASAGETVRALLAAGADLTARSKSGETILQNAISTGNIEVIEALVLAGADVNAPTPDHERTWSEDPKEWPLVQEWEMCRPLYAAACWGWDVFVTFLLDAGADINALSFGWTALHAAAVAAKPAMVQLLLAEGADVHARSADGRTAMDLLEGFRRSAALLRSALPSSD
jgi:ankyrin repeat protein